MSMIFENYKKKIYYSFLSVFTFANFLAFLISRNNAWVLNPGRAWQYASDTEFRNYPASDFERTLSCYGFGQCQRIGGALLMQPIIYLSDTISKIYFWNLSDESRIFIIQMVGFGWRIVCLSMIGYLVLNYSKNLMLATFFINALMLALSGWMLRMFGKVIEILPLQLSSEFKARTILAFQDFPHENLQWYDFGLFAALSAVVVMVTRLSQSQISIMKTILIGILVTSFFEYLGFVFALTWILFESSIKTSYLFWRRSLKIGVFVGLGSVLWLAFIVIYQRFMQVAYPKFFGDRIISEREHVKGIFWAIQHPIQNLTSNPSIPFQILLVTCQSATMGIFLGFIAKKCINRLDFQSQILLALKSISIATATVMFLNFFIAYGVEIQAGEHSRQTLGLQITLFTYLFLRTATRKKTDRPVGVSI